MKVTALIPAAGSGSRMGSSVSKQYLSLGDRPILAHTLAPFQSHPAVERIVLVAPSHEIDFCREAVVDPYAFDKVRAILPGGAERQDSVRLGLLGCGAEDDDIILIHDGVRPFFPSALIDSVIETAIGTGACIVAVPVKDTIKRVENGVVTDTPERSRLWQAQTPQAFRYALIREAHLRAERDRFRGTDDASLVERLGHPVAVLEGSYRNIKVTTPEDMVLANAFFDQERGA